MLIYDPVRWMTELCAFLLWVLGRLFEITYEMWDDPAYALFDMDDCPC